MRPCLHKHSSVPRHLRPRFQSCTQLTASKCSPSMPTTSGNRKRTPSIFEPHFMLLSTSSRLCLCEYEVTTMIRNGEEVCHYYGPRSSGAKLPTCRQCLACLTIMLMRCRKSYCSLILSSTSTITPPTSDHYARLWELQNKSIIRQYNGHHRGAVCVALNDYSETR